MRKQYAVYAAAALALALGIAVLIHFLMLREKEIRWTPQNALIRLEQPIPVTDDQDPTPLLAAMDENITYFTKIDPDTPFTYGPDTFTAAHLLEGLKDFKEKLQQMGLSEPFFDYLRQNYRFYKSAAPEVLFTGYYEAQLKGSQTRTATYRFPLYKKPGDLVRVQLSEFYFYDRYEGLPKMMRGRLTKDNDVLPYYSRHEIDGEGKLNNNDLELVWIDNAVDVFFLHIQGSGIVTMEDGSEMHVNYAESNGHSYKAVGGLLIRENKIKRENMSMQAIRRYLEDHPEERDAIFDYNPSYVFFREVAQGPIGFMGVPVTPYRSIATDHTLFPKGGICYIETELPIFDAEGTVRGWKKFSTFVLNQDTGGAIRTPKRVDLFTGHGQKNEWVAGHMKQTGMFHFLVKK